MAANLNIDFYESGKGETIIVEFPDGGLGIIDAHPSRENSRPPILELVAHRHIHFVCLTHPHADHGVDLIPILKNRKPSEFWHTNPDVSAFIYHCVTERPNYPSPVRRFVNQLADGWADFLLDLYSSLNGIPDRTLHSRVQAENIAGVEIWFLGPDEQMAKNLLKIYKTRASGSSKPLPSPNLLSAVLAMRYGDRLMIFGGDALKPNWTDAIKVHAKEGLPRAVLLKVPHHGSGDALALERGRKNYLDLCIKNGAFVLFAGDSKHPNPRIFEVLRRSGRLLCLSNSLKGAHGPDNPLQLQIPGARQVRSSFMCQPRIRFEVEQNGTMKFTQGTTCTVCS